METKLVNGLHGKKLETIIALPEIPALEDMGRIGQAQLKIYTVKQTRGIVQSHIGVEFDFSTSTMTRMFQDYSVWQKPETIVKTATEKGLRTVHAETLAHIDAIRAAVIAHYAQ